MRAVNLKQIEVLLGPGSSETLVSRNTLAAAYLAADRAADAVALLDPAPESRELSLTTDHPERFASRDILAAAYESLGRWDRAEPLRRELLAFLRDKAPAGSPELAAQLAPIGQCLLRRERWVEAEEALRECLAIRERAMPGSWRHFNAMSLLGWALIGQGRHAEAEPLVVQGYLGLAARAATLPLPARRNLPEAAGRVIRLYEAWDKPEEAAAWKSRLGLADLPEDVFARP